MKRPTKKELRLKALRATAEHIRLIAAINATKFPVYKHGMEMYNAAHVIKNQHMCKLHEFFNPRTNQVLIYGFFTIGDYAVPTFLAEMGYRVTVDDDATMWTAHIPEHLQKSN